LTKLIKENEIRLYGGSKTPDIQKPSSVAVCKIWLTKL
jgi:hypothetical protein